MAICGVQGRLDAQQRSVDDIQKELSQLQGALEATERGIDELKGQLEAGPEGLGAVQTALADHAQQLQVQKEAIDTAMEAMVTRVIVSEMIAEAKATADTQPAHQDATDNSLQHNSDLHVGDIFPPFRSRVLIHVVYSMLLVITDVMYTTYQQSVRFELRSL
eukprot:scaffold653200_cov59-Prasinocladus_malaysianus.AAC.1